MNKDEIGQMLISDDELTRLVNISTQAIQEQFQGEANASPLLMVFEPKGPSKLEGTLVGFPEFGKNRHAIMHDLGGTFYQQGTLPALIIFAFEMWMRQFTPEEARERGRRAVASYEDKTECLMVAALTIDKRTRVSVFDIERDEHARMAGFPPRETPQAFNMPLLEAFYQGYFKAHAETLSSGGNG